MLTTRMNRSACKCLAPLMLLVVLSFVAINTHAAVPCVQQDDLPPVSGNQITVSNASELQNAVSTAAENTTILIKAGDIYLTNTLYVTTPNITLRGLGENCEETNLFGKGMENADYGSVANGIWVNAANLTVTNLTLRDFYYHGISLKNTATNLTVSSVQFLDTGEQLIKANPNGYGVGANNGLIENSIFKYSNTPPTTDHGGGTGYTNAIDVHAGSDWIIRNNWFENFHTPDDADRLWNPAILMWNGAKNTIVENNIFLDTDRAIAFGLKERTQGPDHQGGVIRNNMICYSKGLFSPSRTAGSDAAIIVWDSPDSQVLHNSILTNLNVNKAVEFRFDTAGSSAYNNLSDAPIGSRNGAIFAKANNYHSAIDANFVDSSICNLRLAGDPESIPDGEINELALTDIDGSNRPLTPNLGAHQNIIKSPPMPPANVSSRVLELD